MTHKWNVLLQSICYVCYPPLTESCVFPIWQVEKRLELVKQVSHSTHKKLTACLQGQQGVDVDKKSVRSPSVRGSPWRHSNIYISSVASRFIMWYVMIKYLLDSLRDTRIHFSFRSFRLDCVCVTVCVLIADFSQCWMTHWAKLWRLIHRLFVCFSRRRRSFLSQH